MSIFRVEVVPVVLETHPDADSLSIVKVRGFTVCVKTSDWVDRKIGVYIPPDSVVPDTDQFKFLNTSRRIKVRRLRGIVSMGLLVPAPEGSEVGDDVAELMGITHYETPIELSTSGEARGYPDFYLSIYDVENYYNYPNVLQDGELVQVTEKLHGAQGRWTYHMDEFWCGSKKQWKKVDPRSIWWKVLNDNKEFKDAVKNNPNLVFFGEVFGDVQDLKYEAKKGQLFYAIFDIWNKDTGTFLNTMDCIDICKALNIRHVPILCEKEPFDVTFMKQISSGGSYLGHNIREGIVIKPMYERLDNKIGRVILKIVSDNYLERCK